MTWPDPNRDLRKHASMMIDAMIEAGWTPNRETSTPLIDLAVALEEYLDRPYVRELALAATIAEKDRAYRFTRAWQTLVHLDGMGTLTRQLTGKHQGYRLIG